MRPNQMCIVDNLIRTMRTQSSVEGQQMKQSWKQKQMLLAHLETIYDLWPACKNEV